METKRAESSQIANASSRTPLLYPKRRTDLNVRVVDGETVILDRMGEVIHCCNQTATIIWDQCNGEKAAEEIAKILEERFDVGAGVALDDVCRCLKQLQALNLLESGEE